MTVHPLADARRNSTPAVDGSTIAAPRLKQAVLTGYAPLHTAEDVVGHTEEFSELLGYISRDIKRLQESGWTISTVVVYPPDDNAMEPVLDVEWTATKMFPDEQSAIADSAACTTVQTHIWDLCFDGTKLGFPGQLLSKT